MLLLEASRNASRFDLPRPNSKIGGNICYAPDAYSCSLWLIIYKQPSVGASVEPRPLLANYFSYSSQTDAARPDAPMELTRRAIHVDLRKTATESERLTFSIPDTTHGPSLHVAVSRAFGSAPPKARKPRAHVNGGRGGNTVSSHLPAKVPDGRGTDATAGLCSEPLTSSSSSMSSSNVQHNQPRPTFYDQSPTRSPKTDREFQASGVWSMDRVFWFKHQSGRQVTPEPCCSSSLAS